MTNKLIKFLMCLLCAVYSFGMAAIYRSLFLENRDILYATLFHMSTVLGICYVIISLTKLTEPQEDDN